MLAANKKYISVLDSQWNNILNVINVYVNFDKFVDCVITVERQIENSCHA